MKGASYKLMLFVLTLSFMGHEAYSQNRWTETQKSNFKQKLDKSCIYKEVYCDCVFNGITSKVSPKKISDPKNKSIINGILTECQIRHNTYPAQKNGPELHVSPTSLSVRDENKTVDKGVIRYLSKGKIEFTIQNRPNSSTDSRIMNSESLNDRIAYGCMVKVVSGIKGVKFDKSKVFIGNIPWGGEKAVTLEYTSDTSLVSFGSAMVGIEVYDYNLNDKQIFNVPV